MPEILTSPPPRRLGHQVLVQNSDGAILLEEVTYKPDGLILPGGSAEARELPHLAARRHLETETGLSLPLNRVLAVDYVDSQLLPEGMNFVYWGGRVTKVQVELVAQHRPPQEIVGLHWIHDSQLPELMEADQYRRVKQALAALARGASLPMLLRGVPAE
ncbi:NUDIX domain-containing protein [Kitasatospora sp. NPDC058218]|uniref:NUDIX domain-containing protein n=1 Tax=Kitasatospora sp. NPDC058218 TaxID=3346385 RepID=UPI0036DD21D6